MPLSPTDFQTDVVHWYFIWGCKIFTAYATFIDGFPDRHSPLVLYRELQNIYCIFHKHRRNNSVGVFPVGNVFFLPAFSVCKSIGFWIFFTDKISDRMLNYRWMLCRRTISIGELVGKIFTDKVVILHWQNIFVGKTDNFCM